jgi:cysteinyl-tRNA synthetase
MSMRHLGESFDVHTGGIDLIFPHHEDEIAQSEAATGRPFVRTWLHCHHLQLAGAKMAKSTGNIARVADLLADGVDPRAIRYGLIAVHYRAALSWSDDSLAAAAAALDRLDALVGALEAYEEAVADDPGLPELLAATQARFAAAIADDLNVSASLAALFDFVRDVNRRIDARAISTADAARALALLRDVDAVLGVLPAADDELEPDLRALLDARVEARADRDWAASDRLRDELAVRGISVEDTRDGQRWRRSIDVGRG